MDETIKIELAGGLVIAPSWAAIGALHGKIAALGKTVGHMEKDGSNSFHNYKYISYEQAAAAIRSALPELGLALSVAVSDLKDWDTTRNNKNVERRLVTLEATLTDTETGAMRVIRWYGEGEDQNDKATAKAITSGVKYLLMRNLSISSEDDVEPDAEDGKPSKNASAQPQHKPQGQQKQQARAPQPEPPDDEPAGNGTARVIPPAIEPDAATILKDADKIKSALIDMAASIADQRADNGAVALSTEQRKYLARTLKDACAAVKESEDRHAIYRLVFDADELTIAQASAMIDLWIVKTPDGKAQLKPTAAGQVSTLYRAAQLKAGQRELAA